MVVLMLLTGCGPVVIPRPPPTLPITSVQPTAPNTVRISGLHSRWVAGWSSLPNFTTGHGVARVDIGREWGDIGLSLGPLAPGSLSPTAGVQVGRTLLGDEEAAKSLFEQANARVEASKGLDGYLARSALNEGIGDHAAD